MNLEVKELSPETWDAYADLIRRHGGVWGGCWCMGFQYRQAKAEDCPLNKEEFKRKLVIEGDAHAAIVFDGELAVGWCQYGRGTEVVIRDKFKRLYHPGLVQAPDWRITCFFADRKYRGKGVSSLALRGALESIAKQGGGLVEAYPEEVADRKILMGYIWGGVVPMFEKHGFEKQRLVAKHNWVMTKLVESV